MISAYKLWPRSGERSETSFQPNYRQALGAASRFAVQAKTTLEQRLQQHPGLMLGVAFSIGVTLGWLIKRR